MHEYYGCPMATHGKHSYTWTHRPAFYLNSKMLSPAMLAGVCDYCGKIEHETAD